MGDPRPVYGGCFGSGLQAHIWGQSGHRLRKGLDSFQTCNLHVLSLCIELIHSRLQGLQALCNYRSKFATTAIPVVINYLTTQLDITKADLETNEEQLSQLAKKLLRRDRFLYQGYENITQVSSDLIRMFN